MRKNHSKIVCIKLVHLPYLHKGKLSAYVAAFLHPSSSRFLGVIEYDAG